MLRARFSQPYLTVRVAAAFFTFPLNSISVVDKSNHLNSPQTSYHVQRPQAKCIFSRQLPNPMAAKGEMAEGGERLTAPHSLQTQRKQRNKREERANKREEETWEVMSLGS